MNYETGNPAISKPSLSMMNVLFAMGFIVFMFVNFPNAKAQNSTTFSTPGDSWYTVPEGVTQITVECWGGGGAGGGVSKKGSGGGGAGGAYVRSIIDVEQGEKYKIHVAEAKKGSTGSVSGNKGDASWFGSATTICAEGGNGGYPAANFNTTGSGGAGSIVNSYGQIVYPGGNGADGNNFIKGGAGGGGAGSNGNGSNAIDGTGGLGTSQDGGDGADGVNNNSAGQPGNTYGGGGSGGKAYNNNANQIGGLGAQGQVIISWPSKLEVNPTSIAFGYVQTGSISSVMTYILHGHNLTPASGNITLTCPDNFQISLSESTGFASVLSVPYSNYKVSTTIYVRFLPTTNNTEYSGIITNAGGGAENVNVTISGSSILAYCQPGYTTGTSYEDYISLVQLGSINNSTGALLSPYYYYYENLSTDLIGNNTYAITLRAGTYSSNNNIAVWIDYNRNGTFETNEKLGQLAIGSFTNQGTINFTVPSDAVSGTTRMRVREVWDQSNIDPCSTYSYGETEDYNVNIITSIQVNVSTLSTCPGAQNGTITVNATGGQEPYQYSLNSGAYQSSNTFTGLGAGTYTVSVKDANNKTASQTAEVETSEVSTMPALTATIIPSSCPNSLDGEISVTNIPTSLEFTKADADYINLGGSLLNHLSQFTIEGWIKIDKTLISGDRAWGLFGQNDAIEFGIMNSTTMQLWTEGGGSLNIPMSDYPDDNEWHHLAGVGNGSNLIVYLDGIEVNRASGATSDYGSSTYSTTIGGQIWDATGNYFTGRMLKVSFWSRALSTTEINVLADTRFNQYTNNESGLIAGYNFFEGAGNTLSNVGSVVSNGNLINSPEWKDVFTYNWTKTGDPSFTSTSKNITLINSGEYTLLASLNGICPITGTWVVGSGTANYWTGMADNNWNALENWTCSVPDLNTDANIPTGVSRYPLLSLGNKGACKNLVIESEASVTVTNNTLQIAGTIQNTGTFDAAQGTIEMKGAIAQSIPAGTFNNNLLLNLTINNPAHVTLNGTLLISGVLKAQSGNLITGGYLTLLSTASQTALIDGSGQGEVLGNVTMQRYLPSAFGYKYFGSPFQSATVNEFADDINLNASFPTSYYYDENAPTTGWVAYTNTSASLVPGTGYALNFGTGTTPVTVNTSGVINNGTIGPISLYNHNQLYTKGFNLVSNPYPSPIDWDATGWTKQNIDDALYFFDAGTTDQYQGTYNTYINGISTNGQATNIIGAQQGFFVHISDGSYPIQGALTFTNNVRVNNLNPVFHKNISVGPSSIIRISAGFENARPDYLVVYFNDDSQTGFVATYDALKLMNTATDVPNIYSVSSDGRELSIDALPFPTEDTHVVNLGISSITKGTLIITLADLVNLPAGYGLYLKDNYSGKIQDLQSTPEFRFDINNETYTDRFTLLISKSVLTQEAVGTKSYDAYTRDGSVYLYLKLKEEQVVVKVTDMTGKLVLETTVYGEGHHRIGSLATTGIYIVSIYTDMGIISKKIYLN